MGAVGEMVGTGAQAEGTAARAVATLQGESAFGARKGSWDYVIPTPAARAQITNAYTRASQPAACFLSFPHVCSHPHTHTVTRTQSHTGTHTHTQAPTPTVVAHHRCHGPTRRRLCQHGGPAVTQLGGGGALGAGQVLHLGQWRAKAHAPVGCAVAGGHLDAPVVPGGTAGVRRGAGVPRGCMSYMRSARMAGGSTAGGMLVRAS